MSKSSFSFAGDVLKLTSGTVFAQGLGVVVAPIVTRLFMPEAFGIAALFASITAIIGMVACLRYDLSIMLPESDEEAVNLLGVSLLFVTMITCISALVIFFAHDALINLLNAQRLRKYLWLIPPAILIVGTGMALRNWNSRTKQFGRLSVVQVISSSCMQISKFVCLQKVLDKSGIKIREGFRFQIPFSGRLSNL